MTKKLPLFYFSPTICWVDDDQVFLEAVKNTFSEQYSCLTFSSSKEAFQFLGSYQSPLSKINFTCEFTESDMFYVNDHFPVNIKISEITNLINIPARKNEIAVLIIDNNMPHLNGIDICCKLADYPYKKILLTGDTHPVEAIDAFNQGIISKFVLKNQLDYEKLNKNIRELSFQFFYEKTRNLIDHLETDRLLPLSDKIFIDFFFHWFEDNGFKEMYLINRHGSFLVKDDNGRFAYFIVMSESNKNEFLKFNDDVLVEKISDLFIKFSRGELIPFFGIGKESWDFDFDEWGQHFYPSKVIQGREKYYWTVITEEESK